MRCFSRIVNTVMIAIGLFIAFGAVVTAVTTLRYYVRFHPMTGYQDLDFVGPMLMFSVLITSLSAILAIVAGVMGIRGLGRRGMLVVLGVCNLFTMPIGLLFANIAFIVHLDWGLSCWALAALLIICVVVPIFFVVELIVGAVKGRKPND